MPVFVAFLVSSTQTLTEIKSTYVSKDSLITSLGKIEDRIDSLPSEDFRRRMSNVESKLDKMYDELVELKVLIAKELDK